MKICPSCNIEFNTYNKFCPLCQNKLKGNSKDCIYPKNIKEKGNSIVFKLLLFFSLGVAVIVSFIEFINTKSLKYSIYVYIGLFTNYLITYFIIKNHHHILKMFLKYGLLLDILILIWYYLTGAKVITNYIIPSICLFELAYNFIICIILKEKYFLRYSNLILINLLLLILPTILVLLNQTTNNIMAHICLISAIISIIALIIFFYENIKEEINKIFNI